MANVLRLIMTAGLFWLAFISSPVYAVLPLTNTKVYLGDNNKSFTTASAACASGLAELQAALPQFAPITSTGNDETGSTLNCWYSSARGAEHRGFTISVTTGNCPANSTKTGNSCVCNSGYKETNNQCVKDNICGFLEGKPVPGLPRIEADYGKQSASWAAGQLGKPGLVCTPEQCQASGTVTGCVAGQGEQGTTVCYVTEPKYTGDSCKSDEPPGSTDKPCSPGTKPSAANPAICEPFNTTCPPTHEPSKYVENVCIPKEDTDPNSGPKCEDPKDPTKKVPCEAKPNPCPTGMVPSQYVKDLCIPGGKDGNTTNPNGDKTTCKDGKCTTTSPGGGKTEESQADFCKKNPDNELCKEVKSSFSGNCQMDYKCEGDAVMCAIAKEQHKRNCEEDRLIETDEYKMWWKFRDTSENGIKVIDSIPENREHTITIDGGDEFIGGGSGLADRVISIGKFGSITLPFSKLNYYLEMMGNVFVIICSIVGAMTIIRKH